MSKPLHCFQGGISALHSRHNACCHCGQSRFVAKGKQCSKKPVARAPVPDAELPRWANGRRGGL